MKCPICKEEMYKRGLFTNEVELTIDEEYNTPQYFEDEVEDYRALGNHPDKTWYECFECEIRKY